MNFWHFLLQRLRRTSLPQKYVSIYLTLLTYNVTLLRTSRNIFENMQRDTRRRSTNFGIYYCKCLSRLIDSSCHHFTLEIFTFDSTKRRRKAPVKADTNIEWFDKLDHQIPLINYKELCYKYKVHLF